MARLIQLIFILLIAAFGLAFHIRNDQAVSLSISTTARLKYLCLGPLSVRFTGRCDLLGIMVMLNSVLRLRGEKAANQQTT